MKRIIVILLCFLIGIIISACNRKKSELERLVLAFSKETITIPDGLVRVFDGVIGSAEIRKDLPKMIYWFDSTQCSMCNAKRLNALDSLYVMSEETTPFDIMLVFSPEIKEAGKILETMSFYDLAHPVLVDMDQSFLRLNPAMEDYPFFHRFYVDKKGHPKFVGDPLSSDIMRELFKKVIRREE